MWIKKGNEMYNYSDTKKIKKIPFDKTKLPPPCIAKKYLLTIPIMRLIHNPHYILV